MTRQDHRLSTFRNPGVRRLAKGELRRDRGRTALIFSLAFLPALFGAVVYSQDLYGQSLSGSGLSEAADAEGPTGPTTNP